MSCDYDKIYDGIFDNIKNCYPDIELNISKVNNLLNRTTTDAKNCKNRKFHKYSIFTSNIYFEEISPYSLIIFYLSTFLVLIFNMHMFLDAFKSLSISDSHLLHLNISFPPNLLFIFPQLPHVFDVNSSVITL